ncbi:MAG: RING finger protein [Oscillospiraceae bacterium]|nr:RING finger protein [Oscillospiraceae bacterium]
MAEYTNLKCPVCGNAFSESDDIVVCPECGTPHHRECFKNNGKCANIAWHSENKIYDVESEREKIDDIKRQEERENREREEKEAPDTVCPRCGQRNGAQSIFCSSCGAPISQGFRGRVADGDREPPRFQAMPFGPFVIPQDPNEEIDGVAAWKLSSVVRENQGRFIPQFKAFFKAGRKTSFNACAFLFSPFYFFYRKMYGIGALTLVLTVLFNIPSIIMSFTNEMLSEALDTTVTFALSLNPTQQLWLTNLSFFAYIASMAMRFLCGLFANWMYFKKCKKICAEIDGAVASQEEFKMLANKKGGSNKVIVIALFMVIYLIVFSFSFVLTAGMMGA